jgi:hypothetical protein
MIGAEASRPVQWRPLLILCGTALLYRVPILLNPNALDSDGAVIGLQARHLLRGEWSWFTWGTNYQASFDALVHSLAFSVFGASPFVMVCDTLFAAILMIVLAFLLLERHVGASTALVCCAPMVFAPAAYNHFIQQGFRQWALTTFVAAAYAFDRGRESARWAFFGGLLFFFMLYLDLFTLQAAPALALFALSCLVLGERWRTRVLAAAGGAALSGAFFLWVRRGLPGAPPTQLELSRLPGNVKLLIDQCGPWIIGARALWAPAGGQLRPWNAPAPVVVLQWSGAALLLVAVTFPVFAFIRWWRPGAGPIAPATKFVGLLGSLTIAASVGGFLFSTWPVDLASVRYLALGAVAVPFALAPAASLLGRGRFSLAFAPAIAALLIAGWLGYGESVSGPFPARSPRGVAVEERALREELLGLGVHAAAADYWLSYRLSLLFAEDPVLANIDGWERMPGYRAAFNRAPLRALIFHPSVPQTPPSRYEARLRSRGIRFEERRVADFTVLVYREP